MSNSATFFNRSKLLGCLWAVAAVLLLAGPFDAYGLWDPVEIRVAELSRHLAHQLFDAHTAFADEQLKLVTRGQLGQGELPFTSTALFFAWFGNSALGGRCASFAWALVGVFSLWLLLRRFAHPRTALFGVFALVSMPLFAWQSRLMLGDAATMGALSLATTGLAIGCLTTMPLPERALWLAMGGLGLCAGQLCRGSLVGVAVPATAVGLLGTRYAISLRVQGSRASEDSSVFRDLGATGAVLVRGRAIASLCVLCLGLVAAVTGALEFARSEPGFSFALGATLREFRWGGGFGSAISDLLHSAYPWSVLLPAAVVLAVTRSSNDEPCERERVLGSVLVLVVVLEIVVQGVMQIRQVSFPFPAVAAVAGVCAIAIGRAKVARFGMRLVGVTVASTAILLFADFENLSEKRLLMTGVSKVPLNESLAWDYRRWLTISWGAIVLAAALVVLSDDDARVQPFSRARCRAALRRCRALCEGDLLSGLLLVETALGTTSLLVSAHERGFIFVPIFSAILPVFGAYLKYAWLIPLMAVVVVPSLFLVLREGASWLLSREALRRHVIGHESHGGATRGHSNTTGVLGRPNSGVAAGVLGISIMLSGLCLTVIQMPRLIGQLSSKSVFLTYERTRRHDEPLALLGIGVRAARYYLESAPRTFAQFDAAASWLALVGEQTEARGARRRFMAVSTEDFPSLNAAFRAKAPRRNLSLLTSIDSQSVLVSNASERGVDLNPLGRWVLDGPIPLAHASDGEFGHAVRLEGWEILDADGKVVDRLKVGQSHRLRLGFRVLDPTPQDYRVFVHLESNGQRQIGDHDPVSGLYPTSLWQSGDFIVDEYAFVPERSLGVGTCRIYTGFFQGTARWDVTRAKHDDHRVHLGDLLVR